MNKIVITIFVALLGLSIFAAGAIPYQNSGVVQVDHPENFSRIVAISDVHGMYPNLVQLLMAVHLIDPSLHWLGGRTLLVVVGDSIDKGPYSVEVLNLWMSLYVQARAAGGALIHTLGNHEAEFLADPQNPKAAGFVAELQARGIPLEQVANPTSPLGVFLRSMPMAARVGNWLFVHAGLYPQMTWQSFVTQAQMNLEQGNYQGSFITGPDSPLEAKDWWKDQTAVEGLESSLASNHLSGVVFGHMPDAFHVQNEIGVMNGNLIKIDSGMAPEAGGFLGHLLVFTVPSQLETMSPPQAYSLNNLGVLRPLY